MAIFGVRPRPVGGDRAGSHNRVIAGSRLVEEGLPALTRAGIVVEGCSTFTSINASASAL
jgi:hypothetical protein